MDNYFTDEKTKNIKRRISILSRLELLDIMDIDLNKKLNGIKKKAGSKYKDIDKYFSDILTKEEMKLIEWNEDDVVEFISSHLGD